MNKVNQVCNDKTNSFPEKIFSSALNAAVDAVVISDKAGKILWVNKAFEQLTGYLFLEALGQDTSLLKSGKQDQIFYQQMWQTLNSAEVWQGEMWNKKKSGTLYFEEQTITPLLDENGYISHFIAIKRDISEKVLIKQQLEHTEKMDAIGRIVGGISHNFNNKLASVLGFTQLIDDLQFVKEPATEKLDAYISNIQLAALDAKKLVQQLQTFCHEVQREFQSTSLVVAVGEIIDLINDMLPESIHFSFNTNQHYDDIAADHTLIHQMLMILINNAIEAMPNGGDLNLTITQERVSQDICSSCGQTMQGDYLRLTLRDDGHGIEEHNLKNLFLPFYTTNQMAGNTGMGLSILHGMLHEQNGHLLINSDTDAGTTVTLLFPIAPKQSMKENSIEIVNGNLHLCHILLVDDDKAVVDMIAQFLEFKGFTVTKETDVQSALSALTKYPDKFDLLITDQNMPGITGLMLIRAINNINADIPAILISGHPIESFAEEPYFNELVNGFLAKPFSMDKLHQLTEKLIFTNEN